MPSRGPGRQPPPGSRRPAAERGSARSAAAVVEQLDGLGEHRRRRRLDALAPVVLLRGQPCVVALHREAQDPVLAELGLEIVHVGLEVRHLVLRVAFGFVIVVGLGFGLVVVFVLVGLGFGLVVVFVLVGLRFGLRVPLVGLVVGRIVAGLGLRVLIG